MSLYEPNYDKCQGAGSQVLQRISFAASFTHLKLRREGNIRKIQEGERKHGGRLQDG